MDKVLKALANSNNRKAQFKTVIALNLKGKQHLFTGIAKGQITTKKSGNHGFGYDPIFQPDGYPETFAELALETKNQISHRAKATQLLLSFLNQII